MDDAEVIVLPVVRVERNPGEEEQSPRRRRKKLPPVLPGAPVVDINAFRYARERAEAERRERTSLLPAGDAP